MDLGKILLIMLYLLLSAWAYYVISVEDCQQAIYFIKVLLLLIFIEAVLVLKYDSPCDAVRNICRLNH